jgi:hypothetical protein
MSAHARLASPGLAIRTILRPGRRPNPDRHHGHDPIRVLVVIGLVWAGLTTEYWWSAAVGLVMGGWLLVATAAAIPLAHALHRLDRRPTPHIDVPHPRPIRNCR